MSRRLHVRTALGIGVALCVTSCSRTTPREPAAGNEVVVVSGGASGDVLIEVRQAWISAYNSGDARKLASYFAEDATMLPDGGPAISGRAAIEEYLADDFATGLSAVTILSSEVRVSGDLAVERAEYEARSLASPNGSSRRGKYVIVFRKAADGTWQIQWDVWNGDE